MSDISIESNVVFGTAASDGDDDAAPRQLTGISHWYTVADRNYSMHFIKFSGAA